MTLVKVTSRAVLVVCAALVAGCGSSPTPPGGGASGGASPHGSHPPGHTTSGGTTPGGTTGGGTTAALSPVMYAPTDPCSGITKPETTITSAPFTCQEEWGSYNATLIPGQTAFSGHAFNLTFPSTVSVQPTTTATEAVAWADDFLRDQLFVITDEEGGDYSVATAISGTPAGTTQTAIARGAHILFPECALPSHLSAALLSPAQVATLVTNGWPSATNEALVLTFPACPAGLTAVFPPMSTGPHPVPSTSPSPIPLSSSGGSLVISGSIQNVAPFGPVWIPNGVGACSNPVFAPVCQ